MKFAVVTTTKRTKKILKVIFTFSFLSIGASIFANQSFAEELKSNSFIIQFGNFNVTSGKKSSTSYNVTDTVGQIGNGAYTSSSYALGAGFQYIYQIDTFSFQLSQTAIDLGTLTASAFNTASHTLSITTRGAGGYRVYTYELHPLRRSSGGYSIADTTCNAGTCSESSAGVWTTVTIPGFGFNASGNDIAGDFIDSTYFRQFADREAGETMQSIMSSSNRAANRVATITYKAGISGSQAAGNYQTGVVYVAVPGY